MSPPNSLLNLLMFHWLKVLYVFAVLMALISIPLGSDEVQSFGFKLLAVTVVTDIVVLLLRDYMSVGEWKKLLRRGLLIGLLIMISSLAVVGGRQVWNSPNLT